MAKDTRVTAKLGDWEPPATYNQPLLEPDGEIRTVEHDVLSGTTIVQKTGDKPEKFTLQGDAYQDDIRRLRSMKGERVNIRHPVHSGEVMVKRVSASSTGSFDEGVRTDIEEANYFAVQDEVEEDENLELEFSGERDTFVTEERIEWRKWVYNYTVDLISVR